jgi:endonuclease-3
VVLAHGYGINAGVTVDTHVKRLSNRLKLTKHEDPKKIELDLMKLLPQPDWENWSIRLIYHGRAVCMARKPNCGECHLADLCPSAEMGASKLDKGLSKAGPKQQRSPAKSFKTSRLA